MSQLVGDVDQLLYSTGSNISKEKFDFSDIKKMKNIMGNIVKEAKQIFDTN